MVLLLTHRRDEFVPDRVYAALQHRGARPIRVDTDLFPAHAHFSLRRGPDSGILKIGADHIDLADVAAVW
ncbi:MAG TPA: MvdC family ATP-grasp ribosomal peptide maturase, partial [Myxococcota bacterium]|nr:MvdC family ATP-grasp ribosomal peptide maturase [Myxococcota bacterium]